MLQHEGDLVSEQWTNSRTALILAGPVAVLIEISQQVDLPQESVIETHNGQAVLALWGDPLTVYQEFTRLRRLPIRP